MIQYEYKIERVPSPGFQQVLLLPSSFTHFMSVPVYSSYHAFSFHSAALLDSCKMEDKCDSEVNLIIYYTCTNWTLVQKTIKQV